MAWEAVTYRGTHDDISVPAHDGRDRRDSHSSQRWKLKPREDPRGADAGQTAPCPAPAPLRRRVRIALFLRSPPPSSSGFSNLKPAAFPARAGAPRRERAGPRASQPCLGGSRPAPWMWRRPRARATQARATAGGSSVGSSQRPASRLSGPAERLSPGAGAAD